MNTLSVACYGLQSCYCPDSKLLRGVGKNVAVDRALQLLRAEREYVQLHRDTTASWPKRSFGD